MSEMVVIKELLVGRYGGMDKELTKGKLNLALKHLTYKLLPDRIRRKSQKLA